MQSALDTQEKSLELMTAQEVREITVTKEELYKRMKNNLLQDIMGSVVKLATEQGKMAFDVQFQTKLTNPELIKETSDVFAEKGYVVKIDEKQVKDNQGTSIDLTVLNLSWENQQVQ